MLKGRVESEKRSRRKKRAASLLWEGMVYMRVKMTLMSLRCVLKAMP